MGYLFFPQKNLGCYKWNFWRPLKHSCLRMKLKLQKNRVRFLVCIDFLHKVLWLWFSSEISQPKCIILFKNVLAKRRQMVGLTVVGVFHGVYSRVKEDQSWHDFNQCNHKDGLWILTWIRSDVKTLA